MDLRLLEEYVRFLRQPSGGEDVATSRLAPDVGIQADRVPNAAVLGISALAGCAAAAFSFSLALRSDLVSGELGEPLVIAFLSSFLTVAYVLCGLIAWSRRPGSRFGPLMIAAGVANFLTGLSWTTSDVPFTIGQSFDLVPPVLFLHVFLAYPSGRLRSRSERILVAAAYGTAIVLQLVRMALGGFGPHNLLEVSPDPGAGLAVLRVQLVAVSVFCLCGLGILVARRVREGRPLRRSLALLTDAFALALVMIPFLLVSAAFGGPMVAEIRWATLLTLGLAPVAFLIGLLHDRLARSSVGDLFVELREDPVPADVRDALARALRDPSLTLGFWLPEYRTFADLDGRPLKLPEGDAKRAMTLIDRDGAHVAVLLHDPALDDERELLAAVTAAAGIALENGRLHAALRARLEELQGSRARMVDAGQRERKRLERDLHDGAQQRLIALSLELGLLEDGLRTDPGTRSGSIRPDGDRQVSLKSYAPSRAAFIRPLSAGTGLRLRWSSSPRERPCRCV